MDQLDSSDQPNHLEPTLASGPIPLPELEGESLQAAIELFCFLSDRPLTRKRLVELLEWHCDWPTDLIDDAIEALKGRYNGNQHGFELLEVAGGYQFRSKLALQELAKRWVKVQPHRLSAGCLETLAMVAYRQPILKEEIDQVRGVDSSHFIRQLMDKKLIEISGRSELPGRPLLYATTADFLEVFGLPQLRDLPALREVESLVPHSEVGGAVPEEPHVKKMRSLVQEMKTDVSENLNYDQAQDEAFLADIRERVRQIQTTTPTLEAIQAEEKAAALELQAQPPKQPDLTIEEHGEKQ